MFSFLINLCLLKYSKYLKQPGRSITFVIRYILNAKFRHKLISTGSMKPQSSLQRPKNNDTISKLSTYNNVKSRTVPMDNSNYLKHNIAI